MPGKRPNNSQPQGNQQQQPRPAQQNRVKRKKIRPIGAGKAFALGLLASLIVSVLMSVALIFYAQMRDQRNSDETEKAILDQRQYVNSAIDNFSLAPSEQVRNRALEVSAAISVTFPAGHPKAAGTEKGAGVLFRMSPDNMSTAYILTCYHVIEDAETITVTMNDQSYRATPVGPSDPTSDLAVLRIDDFNKNIEPVDTTRTEELKPGEWCMAIGNPHGFPNSLSVGTISAVGRNIPRNAISSDILYANMIQTDAAINPGSSGGGLWDSHGKLLGIITMAWSTDGAYEGIGLVIPKDYALTIAEALVQGETPAHAFLGAQLDYVPESVVASYGLQSTSGAYVTGVDRGGAAERANIVVGDIIKTFDGKPVREVDDVILTTRGHQVNDKVSVTISRQGREINLELTLGSDAAASN